MAASVVVSPSDRDELRRLSWFPFLKTRLEVNSLSEREPTSLEDLEAKLAADPDHPSLRLDLIKYHHFNGESDKTDDRLRELSAALEGRSDDDALVALAKIAILLKQFDRANAILSRLDSADPVQVALLHIAAGIEYLGAERWLSSPFQFVPLFYRVAYEGPPENMATAREHFKKAGVALEKATQDRAGEGRFWSALSWLHCLRGGLDHALEKRSAMTEASLSQAAFNDHVLKALEKASTLLPDDPSLGGYYLATSLAATESPTGEAASFSELSPHRKKVFREVTERLEKIAKGTDAHAAIACEILCTASMSAHRDPATSLEYASRAYELNPERIAPARMAVALAYITGQVEEGIHWSERLIQVDDCALHRLFAAKLRFMREDFATAQEHVDKALQFSPDSIPALVARGVICLHMHENPQQWEPAFRDLRRAVALFNETEKKERTEWKDVVGNYGILLALRGEKERGRGLLKMLADEGETQDEIQRALELIGD